MQAGSIPVGSTNMGFLGRYQAMATGFATPSGSNPDASTNYLILWLNWIERWSTKPENGGSNPSRIAKFIAEWSSLVARLAHNQEVDGANPSSASNNIRE